MRALSKTPALDLPELAGLDQPSLFDTQPVPTGEPLMVPIDRLDQDPNNPRTEFPQQAIDELAQDIAQRGILHPSSSALRMKVAGTAFASAASAGVPQSRPVSPKCRLSLRRGHTTPTTRSRRT